MMDNIEIGYAMACSDILNYLAKYKRDNSYSKHEEFIMEMEAWILKDSRVQEFLITSKKKVEAKDEADNP